MDERTRTDQDTTQHAAATPDLTSRRATSQPCTLFYLYQPHEPTHAEHRDH